MGPAPVPHSGLSGSGRAHPDARPGKYACAAALLRHDGGLAQGPGSAGRLVPGRNHFHQVISRLLADLSALAARLALSLGMCPGITGGIGIDPGGVLWTGEDPGIVRKVYRSPHPARPGNRQRYFARQRIDQCGGHGFAVSTSALAQHLEPGPCHAAKAARQLGLGSQLFAGRLVDFAHALGRTAKKREHRSCPRRPHFGHAFHQPGVPSALLCFHRAARDGFYCPGYPGQGTAWAGTDADPGPDHD